MNDVERYGIEVGDVWERWPGCNVEILKTNARGRYPIIAIVVDDHEDVKWFTASGMYYNSPSPAVGLNTIRHRNGQPVKRDDDIVPPEQQPKEPSIIEAKITYDDPRHNGMATVLVDGIVHPLHYYRKRDKVRGYVSDVNGWSVVSDSSYGWIWDGIFTTKIAEDKIAEAEFTRPHSVLLEV